MSDIAMTTNNFAKRLRDLAGGPIDAHLADLLSEIADGVSALSALKSDKGWKEATIAWSVCASIHREYAEGKDPFFKTRQVVFTKHEAAARAMIADQSDGNG